MDSADTAYLEFLEKECLEGKRLYRVLSRIPFVYADGKIDNDKCFAEGEEFIAVVDENKRGDPLRNHPWAGKVKEVDINTVDYKYALKLWWVNLSTPTFGRYLIMRD